MANSDINLAERSGNLVESFKSYDPRIIFFYFVLAALLITLVAGLAYQQLMRTDVHADAERQQSQRRIIFPGPRGNIYDRHGKLLVGNDHHFAVRIYLDELKSELHREYIRIRNNYRATGDKDIPNATQLRTISRTSVVQHYLDQINRIIGREEKVSSRRLNLHFDRRLLLPYTLIDDLTPEEYARLLEGLPVRSPLELYASNVRSYPYRSAAAHTLGYVRPTDETEAEDFPGDDLTTFPMPGTKGMSGLEQWFDAQLQGEPGGRIYRVDPTGYKINPPLAERKPKQGQHLITSLDLDLQLVAEQAIGDRTGAAVALDVKTGEVLVLANKPDFDLSQFSPRATQEIVTEMNEKGAWRNNAIAGTYPPGSTYKILVSIAALRRSIIKTDQPVVDCQAYLKIGNSLKPCENGRVRHGEILLPQAIARSCDIFYYEVGRLTTPDAIAEEARRFHLDVPTGIELPHETSLMLAPTPKWKQEHENQRWFPGDTANMAIGQGYVLESPLGMACFAASVARGETYTRPTLVHDPNRPAQHTEPIGLTPQQRAALLEGMEGCTIYGTAKNLSTIPAFKIPGVRIGGKTGTAQKDATIGGKRGKINLAWFICFAPLENPEIAIAVELEGDELGEEYGGGANAAPVAGWILKKYFEKKNAPPPKPAKPLFKTD